jgi:hypothetical protein
LPPGEDVEVKVLNALPHSSATVDDHPVAATVAGVVRDLAHDLEEPAADPRVREIAEAQDVLSRDHERVEGGLRRAVLERHDVGILMKELRADVAARDLAEHTVRHAARIPRWS